MRIGAALVLVLVTILGVRAFDAWRAPPLSLWHTEAPDELDAEAIDTADWAAWLAAEDRAFALVRERVTDKLPAADRVPANRYFAGSPMHATQFSRDWNRSYVALPEGTPRGAVVLLHGLTDSPYSLRHVGEHYRARGFAVVAIRMPGHGTVPAGLARVRWEDWRSATRLAVRHARSIVPADAPLHVVGYSNGGALALQYALESQADDSLARPDQLVLLSPMVGISSFARYSGVLGWPAVFPAFSRAAWLYSVPEYNPFKYNSFPVNGARQSSQLVDAVQKLLSQRAGQEGLRTFPRVLAFQSVLDSTVSTTAVVDHLFRWLPDNGSELVLFDRNHLAAVGPLVRPDSTAILGPLEVAPDREFTLTLVTNRDSGANLVARTVAPRAGGAQETRLSASYPADMYSLSHIALPFPPDDALYGREPRADESYGVRLGTVAVRGERGALVVAVENLMRASCNPFFDYQLERIGATLAD
jgi:alpha-beta hydrolase superfamily lysophospholipase